MDHGNSFCFINTLIYDGEKTKLKVEAVTRFFLRYWKFKLENLKVTSPIFRHGTKDLNFEDFIVVIPVSFFPMFLPEFPF